MKACAVKDCSNLVPEADYIVCQPCIDELDELLRVEMRALLGREPTEAEMMELVETIHARRLN